MSTHALVLEEGSGGLEEALDGYRVSEREENGLDTGTHQAKGSMRMGRWPGSVLS